MAILRTPHLVLAMRPPLLGLKVGNPAILHTPCFTLLFDQAPISTHADCKSPARLPEVPEPPSQPAQIARYSLALAQVCIDQVPYPAIGLTENGFDQFSGVNGICFFS